MVVTKETNLGEILDADPTTAIYFMQIGMHCLGCPASRGENLEQACCRCAKKNAVAKMKDIVLFLTFSCRFLLPLSLAFLFFFRLC